MALRVIPFFILVLNTLVLYSQSADFSTDLPGNNNCGPVTVTFTIDNLDGISTYEWDFGNGEPPVSGTIGGGDDGTSSTTYTDPGQFSPQLTVNGSISTVQAIIIHAIPAPGFEVQDFENCIQASTDVDFRYIDSVPEFGAPISQWVWNYGDGSPEETITVAGHTSHSYTSSGNYTVLVTVKDENNCENSYFEASAVVLNSTPLADFDYNYSENCNFPLDIDLTNQSIDEDGSINSYLWEITEQGTGTVITSSTDENPTLSIPSGGTYDISLRVTTTADCSDEIVKTIVLEDNTVDFTPKTPFEICQGQSVDFTDLSIDGAGQSPVAYQWDFGDGSTSTKQNPTHSYTDISGSPYDVRLEVVFSNGCRSEKTVNGLVTVNFAETVVIQVDSSESCKDFTANFNATAGASEYKWDFEYDGTTPNYSVVTDTNIASYNYSSEDTFHIFLEVTTSNGCIIEQQFDSIVVKYPNADFLATTGEAGCTFTTTDFDASISTNELPSSLNSITTYFWDYNDDGTYDFTSNTPTTSHLYGLEGEYSVKLKIETETGCLDSTTKIHFVQRGVAPTAKFATNQSDMCRSTPVQFINNSASAPIATFPIDSVIWNFGDGTTLSGNPIETPALNTPSHIYSDDTEDNSTPYYVTLQVFSNGCESNVFTDTIEILYPIARFEYPDLGECFPLTSLNFLALDGNRLSEGVNEYRWDFGDGNQFPKDGSWSVGNDPTTTHSYKTLGDFTVTLEVRNTTNGCTDTTSAIVFSKLGIVDFEANDTITCHSNGENLVTFTNKSVTSSPPAEYNWDFGLNAIPQTYTGSTPPGVYYTSPGKKTVTLVMDQGNGCILTTTKTDYIDVRGPIASFSHITTNTDNDIQCIEPDENVVVRSNSNSTPNENINISFDWIFGVDAVPATANQISEDELLVKYNDPGSKSITLIVTDGAGCTDTLTQANIIDVPNPQAQFSNRAIGEGYCNEEQIEFTNESVDEPAFPYTSYVWSFGDGATPSTFNGATPPSVTYSSEGEKTVTLLIANDKGCTDTYEAQIDIYKPNASFQEPGNASCAPIEVPFNNTSTNIQSSFWEFGDGKTATTYSPSNIYFYPGEYDVSLVTTNLGGCKDTALIEDAVIVEGSYYGIFQYTLTGNCLNSPDDPEAVFIITGLHDTKKLTLDFGDGSPAFVHIFPDALNPPQLYTVTHTYTKQGEFTPKLTLEDDPSVPGACGSFVYQPDVNPIIISTPPNAIFTTDLNDTSACQNNSIKFKDRTEKDGGLIDSRYPIVSWYWEFGDGTTSTKKNPTHTYTTAGAYDVDFEVTTEIGCVGITDSIIQVDQELADGTTGGTSNHCVVDDIVLDGATPTGGIDVYEYIWEESLDNSNWADAPGTNDTEDYTLEPKTITSQTIFYYRRTINSGGCSITSPVFEVTIDPETIPGEVIEDATVCYGNNHDTLRLINYLGSVSYWELANNPGFGNSIIVNNQTDTLTYTNITGNRLFARANVQSGVCDADDSEEAELDILNEITGNEIKPDTATCSNNDAGIITASAPGGGEGNFTYQWQNSTDNTTFNDISGATQESYAAGILTETTYFRREVTSDGNCIDISDTMTVTVTPSPDTTLPVQADDVCEDEDGIIIISNSENGYTYDVLDFNNGLAIIASGTGNGGDLTLTVSNTDLPPPGNYFRFIIQTTNGACVEGFPKDSLLVDINPNLNLTFFDAGDVCFGNDGLVTVENSELNYTYEVQDTDQGNTTVGSGAGNGADLAIILLSADLPTSGTFNYQVNVINGACSKPLVNTGDFDIIPTPDSLLSVSDAFVCEETATANTDIVVSNSELNVNYQLYVVAPASPVGAEVAGTGADINLSTSTPIISTQYIVGAISASVDGGNNTCTEVFLEDSSWITIIPIPNDGLSVSSPTICSGDDAEITISNSEQDVNYYLRLSGNNIDTIPGNGSDITFILSPSPSTTTTYEIYAQSSINGDFCAEIKLVDDAIVTVIETPDNTAGVSDHDICEGEGSFVITVNPTVSTVSYTLKTQSGTVVETLNGTDGVLSFSALPEPTSSVVYKVTALPNTSDSDGNSCPEVELLDSSIVTFFPTPDLSLSILNDTVCEGNDGIITIQSSEVDVLYQLREDIGDVLVGTPITGNGSDISFPAITSNATTVYEVIAVRDNSGCSDFIMDEKPVIVVIEAPDNSLNVSPSNATICSGNAQVINVLSTQTDVLYQLRIGTDIVPGESFIGNGGNQSFEVSPTTNTIYNILATPINSDNEGNSCDGVQLIQTVDIVVEGPVSITQQPFDFELCNGTLATFTIEASSGNGGTLLYQWQNSSDNLTYTDIPEGGDYSGTNNNRLIINNAPTHDMEYYRVNIATAACMTLVTSESKQILQSLPPDVSNFIITPPDECKGNDLIVPFSSNLEQGKNYKITYSLSGENNASNLESITSSVAADGSGTFDIPSTEISNIGSTAIIITEIDFAEASDCSSTGLAIVELFNIQDIPNVSGLAINADTICIGDSILVSVSSNLANQVYEFTYDISGSNSVIDQTVNISIVEGAGSFYIPALSIPNSGTSSITIKAVGFTTGTLCDTTGLNVYDDFFIESYPDTIGLTVTVDNICLESSNVATINGNLTNGTYDFIYQISGANDHTNIQEQITTTSGMGTFTIPASVLSNPGSNELLIYEIYNSNGLSCGYNNVVTKDSFDVEYKPQTDSIFIFTIDACQFSTINVVFTSNLINGNYEIEYTLTGDNGFTNNIIDTIAVTSSDGRSFFQLPDGASDNGGLTTVSLIRIKNIDEALGCSSDLIAQTSYNIEAKPDVSGLLVSTQNTCPGIATTSNFSGTLNQGNYFIQFNLSGANTATSLLSSIFIDENGRGSIQIPGSYLINSGTTNITELFLMNDTEISCDTIINGIVSSFEVEELPNTDTINLSSSNICLGNSATVNVLSTLEDNTYSILYDVRGVNNHVNNLDTVVIVGGASSFVVDSTLLTEAGTTEIVITNLIDTSGAQCNTGLGEYGATTFEVEPSPDTTGLVIYALDACEGDAVMVTGVSSLSNSDYSFTYSLTGKNIGGPYTVTVPIISSNGTFDFVIPSSQVPIIGATTITINQIDFETGEMCTANANASSNFFVAPNPNVDNMFISSQDICLEQDEVISLTSELADGTYIFKGNITGANPLAGLEIEVQLSSGDGTGFIVIPSDVITNTGSNTYEVKEVIDQEGANCNTFVAGVTTDFNIEAIPIVDSLKVQVPSVCLGADAYANISGNLVDGTYILTYNLSGDNVGTDLQATLTISSGDGTGEFVIPTAQISNPGSVDIAITDIAIDGGLNCNIPINVTDDFVVVSLTLTFNATIFASDICLGDSNTVNILTNLPNHQYAFEYDLTGANEHLSLSDTTTVVSGLGSFNLKDTLLSNNGTQTVNITGITVLGLESCSVNGLTIDTTFDIQGAISITENPIPDNQCHGSEITLSGDGQNDGPGDLKYKWQESTDGSNFSDINDQGVYSGTNTGTLTISDNTGLNGYYYQLTVNTDQCLTITSDSVQIEVLTGSICGEGLENIPDAFSPNGDGVNDSWYIEGAENYVNNKVKIFNRWGTVVFEANGYDNNSIVFDGNKNKGGNGQVVDGTYFYTIDLGDGSDLISGYLVIQR